MYVKYNSLSVGFGNISKLFLKIILFVLNEDSLNKILIWLEKGSAPIEFIEFITGVSEIDANKFIKPDSNSLYHFFIVRHEATHEEGSNNGHL